jgi:hypothetical protein
VEFAFFAFARDLWPAVSKASSESRMSVPKENRRAWFALLPMVIGNYGPVEIFDLLNR